MPHQDFILQGDYITLDSLLKLLSFAPSGGAAKMMVAEGLVNVDGQLETRKTRKLYAGAVVSIGDDEIRVLAK